VHAPASSPLPLFADVTVQAVKGTAGVLEAKKLQPLKAGMKLKDDATVVTGANSEVVLTVNNGTITLKSLTTAKLRGVAVTATGSKADVALRSGTVVSDVKQIAGLKTSFTITTPVGTSSVRGTTHTVSFSQERGMAVSVASGIVAVASIHGASRPVAAGLGYVQGSGATSPQVATQASLAGPGPGAAAVFSSPEEAAVIAGLGGEAAALSEFVTLITAMKTTGTVNVNLVFP
jgi:hypothetical protein